MEKSMRVNVRVREWLREGTHERTVCRVLGTKWYGQDNVQPLDP